MKRLDLLECTLRDGSYVIDFQFTAEDTAVIVAGLEKAGIRLIEIGHGLGLNASNAGEGKAAATDEEYLEAASSVLKKAKFGMFFIPGIGRKRDLKLASDYGMDFVRIGTNAPEIHRAEPYIKYAKRLDMYVFSNLMKSYALKPKKLAECAKMAETWGADVVTIVDSAGGMLPSDVKTYVNTVREATNVRIGFHGHNNLSLVHANCLAALEAGATILDCSMQGIGRSGGNACTEILLTILKKMGHDLGIDIHKIMDLSEKLIRPLLREKGVSPIDITAGYAFFHSKFLKNVYKAAKKYGIDPRELIIKVSEKDVVHVSEELAMSAARELKKEKQKLRTLKLSEKDLKTYFKVGDFSIPTIRAAAKRIASELQSLSKKKHKESVLTISLTLKPRKSPVFPVVRESATNIIGNAELLTEKQAIEVARTADGFVDFILLDAESVVRAPRLYETLKKEITKSKILLYKETDAWVNAVATLLSRLTEINGKKILICGCNSLSFKLTLNLAERGGEIILWDPDKEKLQRGVEALNLLKKEGSRIINFATDLPRICNKIDILISFALRKPIINEKIVRNLRPNTLILDAAVGSITPGAVRAAHRKHINIYRVDMRAGLSGEVVNVLETDEVVEKNAGYKKIAGVPVVAGGLVGEKGDVVVDSISNPTRVIGIADGTGRLLEKIGPNEKAKIKRVKMEIFKRMLD